MGRLVQPLDRLLAVPHSGLTSSALALATAGDPIVLAAPHDNLLQRTPSTLIQSFICLLLVTYLSVNVVAAYPSSGGHHGHLNLRVPDHRAARFHRRRNR